MIEKKITKLELLHHASTEMVCDWHYLAHMRITDTETGAYIRLHFIVWFDSDDLWEFTYPEAKDITDDMVITDYDIKAMVETLAIATADCCPETMDIWKIKQFISEEINPGIERYNRGNRYLKHVRPYAV